MIGSGVWGQAEFDLRNHKYELYASGEALFALRPTPYPKLDATRRELQACGRWGM